MNVSDLIAKLQGLPSDAEIHGSANWDHDPVVWVEVDGKDIYLINPDDPNWRGE